MNRENPVIEIRKTVRGALPEVPFEHIARSILPRGYDLSLVICGNTLAKRINRIYRKKHYVPNVLSFPLDVREGEIFLNIRAAEREAKKLGVSFRTRLMLLFVHGCLHLQRLRHGKKMERLEKHILRRFI